MFMKPVQMCKVRCAMICTVYLIKTDQGIKALCNDDAVIDCAGIGDIDSAGQAWRGACVEREAHRWR